ncbi:MAG: adenine phosphoribosyltransferase [bacterium]|nr:adenine phosphoribosyltransferase [bacterium]
METIIDTAYLRRHIKDVPNFPKRGIVFKDITPLFRNPKAFGIVVDGLVRQFKDADVQIVMGIESRGFLLSAPMAYVMEVGKVMARKKGKLPGEVIGCAHGLEYGDSVLEIHADAIRKGERVLIIDDVLATGGTVGAAVNLVERLGGIVVGLGFLIDLAEFAQCEGRKKLAGYKIRSLIQY